MKYLYCNDLHLRDSVPENRADDYILKQWNKLYQIFSIAKREGIHEILCGGDIFHVWNSSLGLLKKTVDKFKSSKVPFRTVIGNHCVLGYQLSTLNDSALGVLVSSVPLYTDSTDFIKVIHTRKEIVKDDYFIESDKYSIIISHDMILPTPAIFDHILCSELDGCAKVVLCSHYHKPFIWKGKHTTFINAGSMMRMTVDDNFIPGVVVFEFEGGEVFNIKRIELDIEPYEAVFKKPDKQEKKIVIPDLEFKDIKGTKLIDQVSIAGKTESIEQPVVDECITRINNAEKEIL